MTSKGIYDIQFWEIIVQVWRKKAKIVILRRQDMWYDRINELKKEKGLTAKQIAEKTKLPERTIARIFSGESKSPYVDTLHRIAVALGSSLDAILSDTKVVVGSETLATLQDNVDTTKAELELALAENKILQDKVNTLTAEIDLLKLNLMHKEELLAVHNFYNKIKAKQ
jgi:transcriptional regulator with XRE-family HTH domain